MVLKRFWIYYSAHNATSVEQRDGETERQHKEKNQPRVFGPVRAISDRTPLCSFNLKNTSRRVVLEDRRYVNVCTTKRGGRMRQAGGELPYIGN